MSHRTRFSRIVREQLSRVKTRLSLAGLSVLGISLVGLLAPWPLKIIFDYVLLDKPVPASLAFLGDMLQAGKVPMLTALACAIVALALLNALLSYSQLHITSQIGHQMVYALRRELFAHLQRLSLSFHNRTRCGELMTKVTSDTNLLKDVFADSVLILATHLLTITGMLAVMVALNWRLSLVGLVTVPVHFLVLYVYYRKVKVSARKQRRKEGKLASRLSEKLAAVPLVQAFGREEYETARFDSESTATLEEGIRTARMEAAMTRIVEITSALGTGAVILLGSMQVLKNQMTPGDLLVFASYLANMYKPIRNLARLSAKFSKAMVSVERIKEILDTEPEIEDSLSAIEAERFKGEIVFENVYFDYGDGKEVLKDVSFTMAPGQRVALVGASGAGKSTIVSLILRLYDPMQGRIMIDGVDIKDYRRESLRCQIGVVQQNPLLFGTSIGENIAYGKLDAAMEEIFRAAQAANAHDFILALEEGYDTVIGERGATLSGGERQRIAIARAIIRNAPILILDEPTIGLDVDSQAKVKAALKHLMAGKTCLVITHDLNAATEADRVLILKGGAVIQRDGPLELTTKRHRQRNELSGDCYTDKSAGEGH
jgi:ATP-binding cassette, subfamily B, bacterial